MRNRCTVISKRWATQARINPFSAIMFSFAKRKIIGNSSRLIRRLKHLSKRHPSVLQRLHRWLIGSPFKEDQRLEWQQKHVTQLCEEDQEIQEANLLIQEFTTMLEGHVEVLIVNAQHLNAVPGRKTDIKDAEWIADLLQHGLLRPSFVPPAWQREVRELTRYRISLSEERSRLINRLQKTLEDANIKLASVASDVMGRSARDMLSGLLAGNVDPAVLAELARGRMRSKRDLLTQALQGQLKSSHRILIAEQLTDIDALDEAIERMSTEIAERLREYEHQIQRLSTIPGIKQRLAEVILAEIGPDMSRFPSARHLASWAGICPGNNESAGKRLNGKTRKGSPWLRSALVEAAHAAIHTKDSYLSAQYQRLVVRRAGKKATIAVGHTLLVIIYHLLSEDKDHKELGGNYFDEWDRQAVQKRLVRRLEKLGYQVKLEPTSPVA